MHQRWNDQAIDGLQRRVDGLDERTLTVPERLARIEELLEHISEVADNPGGFDWRLLLSVAATVVVPIVVAIIATGG